MEPAIAAGGLATKTENKVTVCILLVWKTYVQEEDVLIAFSVRILDSVSDGEFSRMQECVGLTSIGSIP